MLISVANFFVFYILQKSLQKYDKYDILDRAIVQKHRLFHCYVSLLDSIFTRIVDI